MPATRHLILIEDEQDIADLLVYNLEREGYQVTAFRDGREGFDAITRIGPDLILLDLMLPGMDGIEICRALRADPRTAGTGIIMVTAKGEESDMVLGLGIGADDYITKPFSPREVIARVKAVLRRNRRSGGNSAEERIDAGPLQIDISRHEAQLDSQPINLTATEFRLLYFLASHPGRVFSRDQIIGHVIGDGAFVVDRNIDVHVRSIRKKLGESKHLIETVRGVGYRFTDCGS